MSFSHKTHEAGAKVTAPGKTTYHGVVWDKTGKRRKNVWTCAHRHREQWAAQNCASGQLAYDMKKVRYEDWEAAPLEILPPAHFYERAGQEGEAFRTRMCKRCYHFPDHHEHLPMLRTTLEIEPGHLEEFARWVGPKLGFRGDKGGIFFSGGKVCRGWMELVWVLGFKQDLAGMKPGERHAKWRLPVKGDSVDSQGIYASQIHPGVVVNRDGTRASAWVVR